jgi:hypothetical protein
MPAQDAQVAISRIGTEALRVPLVGTAPLIVHRFSEKAKRQMLDAMQGRKSPKEAKDPEAEYEAAFYRTDDGGYGIPVIAFKAATVSAARFYGKSVSMTALRQFVFFNAPFSKSAGQKLAPIKSMLTRESVLSLIDAGGMGVGVGEWRPEKKGDFGTFSIDETQDIRVLS